MAEKRKREKLGRRIRNWIADRDYVFLCLFFAVVLGGAAAYLVFQEKKTPPVINTGDLVFSKDNGFYSESLDVEISSKKDGEVRYNLNGDDITNTSEPYSGAIKLEVPEKGYKVYTLGAALCVDAGQCGNIERRTYVLGKNLDEDVDLDIISITSSQRNLYDYEYGIMVGGLKWDENYNVNPTGFIRGNYSERSEEWIRDSHVVMFDSSGNVLFDKHLGIQISGNSSVRMEVKSLKLVGNRKYGYDKIPFDYGNGIELYNSLRLRSGSQDQDSGNIRSSVVSRLASESGFLGCTDTKRAVVFLNGDFYGIFDVQQNYSDSFLIDKFDLPSQSKIIKYKGGEKMVYEWAGIENLFDNDLNSLRNRELLEKYVDMDDYLLYYALEILFNNTDWPDNAFEIWKYDGEYNPDNPFTDGRFRFLIYDTDLTWYVEGNHRYFEGAIGDNLEFVLERKYRGEHAKFLNVMSSNYYRSKFIEILRELINGSFRTNNALRIVEEEAGLIDKQVQIFNPDQYSQWRSMIDLLRTAVSERNNTVAGDIKKYFGVDL